MHADISRRKFLQSSAIGGALLPGSIAVGDMGANKDALRKAPPDKAASAKAAQWPDHFFLKDDFAPVHEEITAEKLTVVGKIPAELDGMFLRNGPNPQFPPLGNYHWFDGDGMVHGVRFQEGRASYRNRYVRTAGWKKEHAAGKALWKGLADPIELQDVAARVLAGQSPFKNTANTALVWHHGKLLALWEMGFPHELQLPNLDTVGAYSFGGALRHALTAHPKIDTQTGEMMAIGYSPLPPFVQYSVFDRSGRMTHTSPIPVRRPVFMHDFAVTEHHTILLELPAVFDPYSARSGGEFVRYQPELGARVGVLPRHGKGDEIRWFEIQTCFVYHILNAFEAAQKIRLFACRMPQYPKAFGLTTTVTADDFSEIYNDSKPVMYRWTFDLETGTVREEPLDDMLAEFPRVNDRLIGRATRYGYAINGDHNSSKLLRYDLQNGQIARHDFGKGRIAGETVFARRPDGVAEDDGWLVTYVFDHASQQSECVVLDARDMTAQPVARVILPQRVPYGFHALWIEGVAL